MDAKQAKKNSDEHNMRELSKPISQVRLNRYIKKLGDNIFCLSMIGRYRYIVPKWIWNRPLNEVERERDLALQHFRDLGYNIKINYRLLKCFGVSSIVISWGEHEQSTADSNSGT